MPEFISNTLIHWTGRNKPDEVAFEIIEKIINTKNFFLPIAQTILGYQITDN
jgi:hypothetical protein